MPNDTNRNPSSGNKSNRPRQRDKKQRSPSHERRPLEEVPGRDNRPESIPEESNW